MKHVTPENHNLDVDTQAPHQEPATPKQWVFVSMILLAFATIGVGSYLYATRPTAQDREEAKATRYLTNQNEVVCVSMNNTSMQCENVETGELKKLLLPEIFGEITGIEPSPDQGKLMVRGYRVEKDDKATVTDIVTITDMSLKPLKSLTNNNTDRLTSYFWYGNDALLRLTDIYKTDGEQQQKLDAVSVNTDSTQPMNITGITYLTVLGGDGKQAFISHSSNTHEFQISSVSPDRNPETIDEGSFFYAPDGTNDTDNATDPSFQYNASANLFYATIGQYTDDSRVIRMGELQRSNGKPIIDTVYDTREQIFESPVLLTTKGAMHADLNDIEPKANYRLVTPSGATQSLNLPVSGHMFIFSLKNFPQLTAAESAQLVPSDFVDAPKNTPAQVRNFLEQRTTNDCTTNSYRRVTLVAAVGTSQLMLSEHGCGMGATYYYIYKSGAYKEVYVSQEGIGCDTRDDLGLSPQLVQDCRKPGEPL